MTPQTCSALLATLALSACAESTLEQVFQGQPSGDLFPSQRASFDPSTSPCFRPEVDAEDGEVFRGRSGDGRAFAREDTAALLQSTGAVEVNLPEFLDRAAPTMVVITVNVNSGLTVLWGLRSEGGERQIEELVRFYALVGDHIQPGPADYSPWSSDGRYCFDRAAGIIFDNRGLPRRNYSPMLITEVVGTFSSPTFVDIPPADRIAGGNGATDIVIARWFEDEGDGLMSGGHWTVDSRSDTNSNFTLHEVPPSIFYRHEQDRMNLIRCANAVLPGGLATATPPRADCDFEYLRSQHWPEWSGGCINIEPDEHWGIVSALIRGARQATAELQTTTSFYSGASMYVVQGFPGVDQRLYIKDDGYRELLLNEFYPPWIDD